MKKILLFALTAFMAAGCDDAETYYTTKEGMDVAIIDSCEYIKNYTHGGCITYTHKGNCKFCEKRDKQKTEELIKKLKEM